jgi:hypothetical protein
MLLVLLLYDMSHAYILLLGSASMHAGIAGANAGHHQPTPAYLIVTNDEVMMLSSIADESCIN